MYDAKAVSPMEDYNRRNAKASKIENKRIGLQERRNALMEELRGCRDADRCLEIGLELLGIRLDLEQLHQEILEVWRARY